MMPVTVLVTTRNEEANIEKCLQSVFGFVNQVLVLDSDSQDQTVPIARKYADEIVNLPYEHGRIIPWIWQWGLDHLPIRNEWILLLECDQQVTPELLQELQDLFARPHIEENGFYVRRKQMFRGRWIRHGGYGSKHLLKLFRRGTGELDVKEQDTRVYVQGKLGKLRAPLLEDNRKEDEIMFYLQKHLRYAQAFAQEELERRRAGLRFKTSPSLFGNPDQRVLWLKSLYYRLPLFIRPFLYFFYRYFFRLGFLDGKEGFIFHFMAGFWFRLVVDIRMQELLKELDGRSCDGESGNHALPRQEHVAGNSVAGKQP
jgi:glycosyltransferase involved in cell wall biosynthesis